MRHYPIFLNYKALSEMNNLFLGRICILCQNKAFVTPCIRQYHLKTSAVCTKCLFLRNISYFLLINPWNHSGKLPLWRIKGAWVSVNHFRASSLSLLSVFSWTSPPGWQWSILTRSCVNIEGQMRRRTRCPVPPALNAAGPHQQSHLPIFPATS